MQLFNVKHTTPARLITRLAVALLAVSAVIAVLVYVGSSMLPKTYGSSAEVLVNVSGSDPNSTSQGADSLASQYSQQVNSSQVLAIADKSLGANVQIPSGSVSAGVVAAQNLIQISVSNSDPVIAQKVAQAVSDAFVLYVNEQNKAQALRTSEAEQTQLAPLKNQIAGLQRQLSAAERSKAANAAQKVSNLNTQISNLQVQVAAAEAQFATAAATAQTSLTQVSAASDGSQTAPKPKLYALVAFVIAFLIGLRVAMLLYRRRFPKLAPQMPGPMPAENFNQQGQRLLSPPAYTPQAIHDPNAVHLRGAGGSSPQYFVVDGEIVAPVAFSDLETHAHNDPYAQDDPHGDAQVHHDPHGDTPPEPVAGRAAHGFTGPSASSDSQRSAPIANDLVGTITNQYPSRAMTPITDDSDDQRVTTRSMAAPTSHGVDRDDTEVYSGTVVEVVEDRRGAGDRRATDAAVPPWRVPTPNEQPSRSSESRLVREGGMAFGAALLIGALLPRKRRRRRS